MATPTSSNAGTTINNDDDDHIMMPKLESDSSTGVLTRGFDRIPSSMASTTSEYKSELKFSLETVGVASTLTTAPIPTTITNNSNPNKKSRVVQHPIVTSSSSSSGHILDAAGSDNENDDDDDNRTISETKQKPHTKARTSKSIVPIFPPGSDMHYLQSFLHSISGHCQFTTVDTMLDLEHGSSIEQINQKYTPTGMLDTTGNFHDPSDSCVIQSFLQQFVLVPAVYTCIQSAITQLHTLDDYRGRPISRATLIDILKSDFDAIGMLSMLCGNLYQTNRPMRGAWIGASGAAILKNQLCNINEYFRRWRP